MDRRLRVPLLVAAAFHVLVGAGAGWVHVPPPTPGPAGPRNVEPELEATLDELGSIPVAAPTGPTQAAPSDPPTDPTVLPPVAPRVGGVVASLGGGAGVGPAIPDSKESVGAVGGPTGAASTTGSEATAGVEGPSKPFPSLVDLSSPGKHAFILPPPKPSTSPEVAAQNKLDASLAAATAAKDKEIGLGPGGPVVSAAHDVSIGSEAPDTGTATVDVETDATGMVTEVHLVESSDAVAWKKVATKLKKRLATTHLTVPKGAGGVTVRVKITAAVKLPSGAAPGQPVTVYPKEIGIGGQFDLADIGQKPKRVVGVTVLRETKK